MAEGTTTARATARARVGRCVDGLQSAWVWARDRASWPWVALAVFVWLAATTWMYPLLLPDEGRYVGVAREMIASGDFWTPRLDGLPFFHKPPLFYWLTSGALALFGDHAWAGRLCSVLAATAMAAALHAFLTRYARRRVASTTVLILVVQPFLFGAAHYANMDMLVAALMSLTVLAGADAVFRHEQYRDDRRALLAMQAAAAAGFLAKGLIGVVLPAGILLIWLLARRRFRAALRLLWWPGVVLFLVLVLPWMVVMQVRYPAFFDYFILDQHVRRFLSSGFNNPQPVWFYVPVVLGLTLPWSLRLWRWFSPKGPLQAGFVPPADRIEQVDRSVLRGLMVTWLLVVLVFFSIPSSKLVGYVAALLPPLAWLVQETFEQVEAEGRPGSQRRLVWHGLIAAAVCLLAVLVMLIFPQRSTRPLARVLAAEAMPGDDLVMLDQYAYDLPFYAGWSGPVRVVTDWADPHLTEHDNWRLELHDAARFDPLAGRQRLWSMADLHAALCAPDHPRIWLLAYLDEADWFGVLSAHEPVARTRKMGLWKIAAGEGVSRCDEMPSNAPE